MKIGKIFWIGLKLVLVLILAGILYLIASVIIKGVTNGSIVNASPETQLGFIVLFILFYIFIIGYLAIKFKKWIFK